MTWQPWPDDVTERASDLWKEGITAAQIARMLGYTRSAVVGKMNRLGLVRNPTKNVKQRVYRRKAKPISGASLRRKAPERAPVLPADAPAHPPVALLDLEPWHCRYPVEGGFCGAKTCTRGHGSYCSHHAEICYRGFPDRKRRVAQ